MDNGISYMKENLKEHYGEDLTLEDILNGRLNFNKIHELFHSAELFSQNLAPHVLGIYQMSEIRHLIDDIELLIFANCKDSNLTYPRPEELSDDILEFKRIVFSVKYMLEISEIPMLCSNADFLLLPRRAPLHSELDQGMFGRLKFVLKELKSALPSKRQSVNFDDPEGVHMRNILTNIEFNIFQSAKPEDAIVSHLRSIPKSSLQYIRERGIVPTVDKIRDQRDLVATEMEIYRNILKIKRKHKRT